MSLDTQALQGPYETVLDVGAFRGDFARACLQAWPGCRVESFEPLEPKPDDVGDAGSWRWHPVALGEKPGVLPINECEFVPSSSFLTMTDLHKNAFPYTRGHTRREVTVRALDDYAPFTHGKTLLKIDVQGWEFEVLHGAKSTLYNVAAVVSEVSWAELYEEAPAFEDLDAFLAGRGFRHAHRVDEMPDPKSGQVLQSDELWTR